MVAVSSFGLAVFTALSTVQDNCDIFRPDMIAEYGTSPSAMGRLLPVAILRDFSSTTTCHAGTNGRVRPGAVCLTQESSSARQM
jgi:hypothetical protein